MLSCGQGTLYELVLEIYKGGGDNTVSALLSALSDVVSGCAYLHGRSPSVLHRRHSLASPSTASTCTYYLHLLLHVLLHLYYLHFYRLHIRSLTPELLTSAFSECLPLTTTYTYSS